MTASVQMTEDELQEAEGRTQSAIAAHEMQRKAAEALLADRMAAGGTAVAPETALDRGVPRSDSTGLPTQEQFDAETEGRANLDIILGLREIEGAESVRWKISRLSDPTGRKPTGYLTEWSTDILSTARIQEDYGAGTYRVVGTRMNGQYAAMRTIKIAEDSKTPPASQHTQQSESAQGSTPMSEFMTIMLQQNEQRRQEDIDRERREEARDERRRKERMEMMQIAAPVVAAVVPALFGNRGPDIAALITATRGPSLAETLTTLRELNPPAPVSGASPIDTALKLFDRFTDLAPKAGGETGWADVLKEIVRSVGPAVGPVVQGLATMAQARQRQMPPQVQLPAPLVQPAGPPDLYGGMSPPAAESSAPPAPIDSNVIPFPQNEDSQSAAPQGQGDDVNLVQMIKLTPWLKGQISDLLVRAARGSNPSLYAEVVLDSIPENINGDVLLEFLKRPDWLQMLTTFDSRVAQHAAWFSELRGDIIKTGEEIKAELAQASTAAAPAKPSPVADGEIDRPTGPPTLNPIG
jgi:hypothetical protein